MERPHFHARFTLQASLTPFADAAVSTKILFSRLRGAMSGMPTEAKARAAFTRPKVKERTKNTKLCEMSAAGYETDNRADHHVYWNTFF